MILVHPSFVGRRRFPVSISAGDGLGGGRKRPTRCLGVEAQAFSVASREVFILENECGIKERDSSGREARQQDSNKPVKFISCLSDLHFNSCERKLTGLQRFCVRF